MSQISGSIHVAAPKPIDDRFRMFATLEECKSAIPSNERYQGLEVNIDGSKYWWRDGVNDNQLVPMPSGGGGSTSDDISNESGVIGATVTDALDTLDSAVTSANNTANYAAGVADGANTAANDAATAASNAQNTANNALSVANAALPDTANFGGDVSGTYNNLTVSKIHGVDVMSGNPTHGDFLIYEDGGNNKWQHRAAEIADISGLQTALNGKQNLLGYTPENAANNPVRTLNIMSAAVTTGNTTSAVTCYTFTVNQSSLRSRSKLLWDIVFQAPGTANNKIITLECNGVSILTGILINSGNTLRTIPMQWFTGTQLRFATSNNSSNNFGGVGTGSSFMNSVNPDGSGNFVFSIKIQKAVGTDTAVLESVDLSLRY